MTKKAIVTGASSGIGRALVLKLTAADYQVGALARREGRLRELKALAPQQIEIATVDVSNPDLCQAAIKTMIGRLGDLDLCVANAGIGRRNFDFELEPELETIGVNVNGFVATLQAAADYFKQQGRGHLVGVSSVAALRGNGAVPAYNATKAFEANYLEGLAINLSRYDIAVTDIRPGFVDTEMTKENEHMFWVATSEAAAAQIYRAIRRRKRIAYITSRWRWPAWLMRLLPYKLWRQGQLRYLGQSSRG